MAQEPNFKVGDKIKAIRCIPGLIKIGDIFICEEISDRKVCGCTGYSCKIEVNWSTSHDELYCSKQGIYIQPNSENCNYFPCEIFIKFENELSTFTYEQALKLVSKN